MWTYTYSWLISVGVPGYRISQMVAAGGNILDAYGLVNVVSPSGLPMRGIVGISPDPIMLVAINCANVKESAAFYENLGFTEQVRLHTECLLQTQLCLIPSTLLFEGVSFFTPFERNYYF